MPPDVATDQEDAAAPNTRLWGFNGDESLHPFWFVRRLTKDALKKAQAQASALDGVPAAYNLELDTYPFHVVSIGSTGSAAVQSVYRVLVPFFVNHNPIPANGELIAELTPPPKKIVNQGTTWKDESRAKARKVSAAAAKQATPTPKKLKTGIERLEIGEV